MIEKINDSKTHYFVWLAVTAVIFAALLIGGNDLLNYAKSTSGEEIPSYARTILLGCCYLIATCPIGFAVRRKFMHWYAPILSPSVGTVQDDYIEGHNHPIRTLFRFLRFDICLIFDIILFAFYLAVSFIIGIFIFPYHLISGIVFMCQKKI